MLEASPAADGQVNNPTRRAAQPCKGNAAGIVRAVTLQAAVHIIGIVKGGGEVRIFKAQQHTQGIAGAQSVVLHSQCSA
jgi:hypothetical protein